MSVQPIRLFGDPVLRTPAEVVTDFDKQLRALVADLTETMLDAPGSGLAAPQIAHLSPHQRERVMQMAGSLGTVLVGKLVTRDLLMTLARHAGMKLSAKQAARFVPLAGQVVSAALGYAALRAMGEQHIKDCVQVARAAQLVLPGPVGANGRTEAAALSPGAPRPFWRRLSAR